MGIVDRNLGTFELDGFGTCEIEYNTNGIVHLHLGDVRLELSPKEFRQFATVVTEARDTLIQRKQLQQTPVSDPTAELTNDERARDRQHVMRR